MTASRTDLWLWPSLEGISCTDEADLWLLGFLFIDRSSGREQEGLMRDLIEQEVFQSFRVAKAMPAAWVFILSPA